MRKTINTPVRLDLFGEPIEESPRQTSTAIMPLDFGRHKVRMLIIKGQPWWMLSDLAKALGYRDAEVASRILKANQTTTPQNGSWGIRSDSILVSESGLYRLIGRSNKPEAEQFQDWITEEVLPSIRRTGTYTLPSLTRVAKVKRRLKCDDATANRRVEVIDENKSSHARLAGCGASHRDFAEWNNATYRGQTGRTAAQLRELLGQKKYETPLDRMSGLMLAQHQHAKMLANQIIRDKGGMPIASQCETVENAAYEIARADIRYLGGDCFLAVTDDPNRGKVLGHVHRQLVSPSVN